MDHIEERAANLVRAIEDVYEATGAFAIDTFDSEMEAQVQPEEFEKIAAGRDTRLTSRGTPEWPYQNEVMIGGIKFFCLLTAEEKADAIEAAARRKAELDAADRADAEGKAMASAALGGR